MENNVGTGSLSYAHIRCQNVVECWNWITNRLDFEMIVLIKNETVSKRKKRIRLSHGIIPIDFSKFKAIIAQQPKV